MPIKPISLEHKPIVKERASLPNTMAIHKQQQKQIHICVLLPHQTYLEDLPQKTPWNGTPDWCCCPSPENIFLIKYFQLVDSFLRLNQTFGQSWLVLSIQIGGLVSAGRGPSHHLTSTFFCFFKWACQGLKLRLSAIWIRFCSTEQETLTRVFF